MIAYLIKMIFCALLLLAIYALLLERENMHVFKRIYLLSSIIFSMVVPLINLPIPLPPMTANISALSDGVGNMIETGDNQILIIEQINQTEDMQIVSSVDYPFNLSFG